MNTHFAKITDPSRPADKAEIERAASIIRDGGLVVFPTETVYGLGGNATDAEASRKIYAAKGRPSDNPLIIHIARPEDASLYAETNETYFRLAEAFMPGPLTVIMAKKDNIPYATTGGLESVAVRCPSHPVAHALIAAAGVPIAAPSANVSGKPSPTCAEHVVKDMDGKVDMILDGGSCEIGLESTIVKIDGGTPVLLRPGGITYDDLVRVLGKVDISRAVTEQLDPGEKPLSPGMKYKHYAPSAQVILLEGSEEKILAFLREKQKTEDCAILCYTEEKEKLSNKNLIDVGRADDLERQAHLLFAALREVDLHDDIKTVYAHLPPKTGIGLALYNRMIRAAAHTVLTL